MNKFMEDLKTKLQENPEDVYVTDQYIAVLIDDDVLVMPGDFKDATPDQVNLHIIKMIDHLTR